MPLRQKDVMIMTYKKEMKKLFSTLMSIAFAVALFTSLEARAFTCEPYEQDGKVLTDFDCPGNPGQIYKECVSNITKCCDAANTESCPSDDL